MLEALLQAVREAPDDDAPRLVLADWLAEQPGPAIQARGDFIRLQCFRSRAEDAKESADLARQASAIRAAHGERWPDVAAGARATLVHSRGMARLIAETD